MPYWALLLTPGWRELAGKSLPDIVAGQWKAATTVLLDDLAALPEGRCQTIRYGDFVANPAAEIGRLCTGLDLQWDRPLEGPLPLARHTVTRPDPEKWRARAKEIESVMPGLLDTIERAEQAVGA
jgi:hypothetical protein